MDEKEINRKVRICFTNLDDGTLKCKLNNCNADFKKDIISVLKRHLIRKHKTVAKSLYLMSSKEIATEIVNSKFSRQIKVNISQNSVYKYFVKLTTHHHIPIAIMDYPATKEFLDPICKQLNMTINSKIGLSAIKFCDEKIIEIIKSETKNLLLSLKMDLATRHRRSVLGKQL